MIQDLKKRRVKGSLSKMNKAQLQEMHAKAMEAATDENTTLDVTAGAAATILPLGGGGISLAPLPGSTPVAKPKPRAGQQGSGAYRDFVRANLSKHKGDMKAVAAAYRAQKGGGDAHGQFMKATHSYCAQKGGHFYNVKGEATSMKGKHNHVHGTNPKKVRKMPPGLAGSGVGSSRFTVGERQRPIMPYRPDFRTGPRQATAFALGDQPRTGRDSVVRQQLSSDLVEAILKKVPPPKAHPAFASLSDRMFVKRKTHQFDVPNPITDALVHRAKAKGLHPSDPLNHYPMKYDHMGAPTMTREQNRAKNQYVDDFYDESLPKEKRLLQGARARVLDETPEHAGMAAEVEGQTGAGHCQCKGGGVEQYMEGGHWWNDAWNSVKHAASAVGHDVSQAAKTVGQDVSKAYHTVQNNSTVREVEKGVANFGVNALAREGEGLVDAAADTASFLTAQPELAAAADVGVHELANLAQSGVKKGVDSVIDHTAQSGNGLMLPVPF